MQNTIIKLDKVSWAYSRDKEWALREISLEIEAGSFIAVMGCNGAGKSSFCRLLNGLIPHSLEGTLLGAVTIDGDDTRSSSVAQLAKKVGMAFEDPITQLFTTSVYNETAFALENLLLGSEEIAAKVRQALDAAGLWEHRDYPPSDLSGGQKQRLTIAAALAMANKLLVLDEPTSQRDPLGAREVLSFIRDLRAQKGLTVVMATGSGEEAAEFAEKILVLKEGRLAAFGTPKDIFADKELLSSCMIDPPHVSEFAVCMAERGHPLPRFPVSLDEALESMRDFIKNLHPSVPHSPGHVSASVSATSLRSSIKEPVNNGAEAVRISNLRHWYDPGRIILDGINISIADGEFAAIIGQNGSGKTTLIKNISGLLRPRQGEIFIRGQNTAGADIAEIAREAGYVMQDHDNQLFEQTLFDEVAFSLKSTGSKKEITEKVEEALETVGLLDKKDAFPPALPRADRAKAVFAAVLAMGTGILLLDEPVAGQDGRGCRMIMDIIAGLHRKGKTIILITHNIGIAAQYARRIIVMKSAHILMDGPPSEIFGQREKLAEAGILAPQITRLSQEIRARMALEKDALTPDELAEMLVKR
jgi:energy-coupling factor transport system ATP-binding protein